MVVIDTVLRTMRIELALARLFLYSIRTRAHSPTLMLPPEDPAMQRVALDPSLRVSLSVWVCGCASIQRHFTAILPPLQRPITPFQVSTLQSAERDTSAELARWNKDARRLEEEVSSAS
jgi:hypothetical protein